MASEGTGSPPSFEQVQIVNAPPTGACTLPNTLVKCTVGAGAGLYQCIDGQWTQIGGANPLVPAIIYSAAGTPLPVASAALLGARAIVSDADTPAYMGAYTSGGTQTCAVVCSYNGSVYQWLTN
jgi:hypothetical protein